MDTSKILPILRAEQDRIMRAIDALEALTESVFLKPASRIAKGIRSKINAAGSRKRVISAAARKKISDAAKERWAQKKRAPKPAPKTAAAVSPAAPAVAKKAAKKATPKKTKGGITAAGRKRISEAAKARWAKQKRTEKAVARKTAAPPVAPAIVKEPPKA